MSPSLDRRHTAIHPPRYPQVVENSGENPVDEEWTGVDEAPAAVDERWTPRPHPLGIVRGRAVDADYRGPHATRNYTAVMWTAVDERPVAPHRLHTPDRALTCTDGRRPQCPHPR